MCFSSRENGIYVAPYNSRRFISAARGVLVNMFIHFISNCDTCGSVFSNNSHPVDYSNDMVFRTVKVSETCMNIICKEAIMCIVQKLSGATTMISTHLK